MSKSTKNEARQRRHIRVRKQVSGTSLIPRLSVCCTAKHIYVQFIDDEAGKTMAAVSTVDKAFRESKMGPNAKGAALLGKLAAERATAKSIARVVFDRGGFKYHGRVKAVADAARAAGLQF